LRIEKKGEKEIEGITDSDKPRRQGPKRANYIRKVFALRNNKKEGKVDDVRKYVVRREIKKGDKTFYKSPKIQRLITERRIRRNTLKNFRTNNKSQIKKAGFQFTTTFVIDRSVKNGWHHTDWSAVRDSKDGGESRERISRVERFPERRKLRCGQRLVPVIGSSLISS
jgi:hypothetical protein